MLFPISILKGIRRCLSRGFKSQRGNTTVTMALLAVPMLITIGGAVDFGRVISARARLQDAADTAALAGALRATSTLQIQKSEANKAFAANLLGTGLEGSSGELTPVTENNVLTFTYDAHANVPTIMLGIIGRSTIRVDVLAKAGTSLNSAEIVFVLDTTGSMSSNDKMTQLKASMDSVLASLLDSNGTNSGRTKVAIVPFDTQVALDDVANMTNYAGEFTSQTRVDACTGLSDLNCSGIVNNYLDMCTVSGSLNSDCVTNQRTYTRSYTSNGKTYYSVFATSYYRSNQTYRYYGNTYYYYQVLKQTITYQVSGSTLTQTSESEDGTLYYSAAYYEEPNHYSRYNGTITSSVPPTGGYNSTNTTVIKSNDTISANSDLLGVGTENWSGCVIDRTQPYDVSANSPIAGTANSLYPAAKCATNSLLPIMGLTTDIAAARAHAQKLKPAGNTNITIGIQWGMEVLTPSAPFSEGVAFTDTSVTKYMIIMTDGDNTQNRWTTNTSQINARTAAACQAAKDMKIVVFTVRIMAGDSSMLETCASKKEYYYNLTNANQINGTLGSIMKSIKKIRLTR